MRIVDLNVLLYVINRDSPHHELSRTWWEAALRGDEPIGLTWLVLLGFLRLTTNPRVFSSPLSLEQSLRKVDVWLSHPLIRIVREADEHWRTLRELIAETGAAGNLTTDAHLAALAIAHGAVLVTWDTDFARFSKLRWEFPQAKT